MEPEVSEPLHRIIESGFEKQRWLQEQRRIGDISEREFGALRRQYRREGREAVVDLLGEDSAREFDAILREEGQKTREEREQRMEEEENP